MCAFFLPGFKTSYTMQMQHALAKDLQDIPLLPAYNGLQCQVVSCVPNSGILHNNRYISVYEYISIWIKGILRIIIEMTDIRICIDNVD